MVTVICGVNQIFRHLEIVARFSLEVEKEILLILEMAQISPCVC